MLTEKQEQLVLELASTGVCDASKLRQLLEQKSSIEAYKEAARGVKHSDLAPEYTTKTYIFARAIEAQGIASWGEAFTASFNQSQATAWKARFLEMKSRLNVQAVSPETRQAWKSEEEEWIKERGKECIQR
jgi:hypothetical protein